MLVKKRKLKNTQAEIKFALISSSLSVQQYPVGYVLYNPAVVFTLDKTIKKFYKEWKSKIILILNKYYQRNESENLWR